LIDTGRQDASREGGWSKTSGYTGSGQIRRSTWSEAALHHLYFSKRHSAISMFSIAEFRQVN